jgi:hypothetical protein
MRTFDSTEQNWRALAEKASKEQDPEKLLILAEQLLEALKPELAGHPPLQSSRSTSSHPRYDNRPRPAL